MKCIITEIVRRDQTQAEWLPLKKQNVTNTKTHNATYLYIRLLRIFNNYWLTETHSVIDYYYTKVSKRVTHLIWLESPFLQHMRWREFSWLYHWRKKESETDTATFWCGKFLVWNVKKYKSSLYSLTKSIFVVGVCKILKISRYWGIMDYTLFICFNMIDNEKSYFMRIESSYL